MLKEYVADDYLYAYKQQWWLQHEISKWDKGISKPMVLNWFALTAQYMKRLMITTKTNWSLAKYF